MGKMTSDNESAGTRLAPLSTTSQFFAEYTGNLADIRGIPEELTGVNGDFRVRDGEPSSIEAHNDIEAIMLWLDQHEHNMNSYNNYRREAERLLFWALLKRGRPLSSLRASDLGDYEKFLADPDSDWIMQTHTNTDEEAKTKKKKKKQVDTHAPGLQGNKATGHKWPRGSAQWRPFASPLSDSSRQLSMSIVKSLYAWMAAGRYLSHNPMIIAKKWKRTDESDKRQVPEEFWDDVMETINKMPDVARRARTRWIFIVLYRCGLRISELVNATMGAIYRQTDRDGKSYCWIQVTGKGDKEREVPLTDQVLDELKLYRNTCGLSDFPVRWEGKPLVLPLSSVLKRRMEAAEKHRQAGEQDVHIGVTRSLVHSIIKQVFEETANRIALNDADRTNAAIKLQKASAHWMRHSCASNMVNNGIPISSARDFLGHENISTTNKYLHSDKKALYDQIKEMDRKK